ncbi:AraC family transcriptional regulator [Flavobacterium sp. MXW15]|uniref:AraC family transcriptional regulator n=1 Tax=Xanthomonas chitinilytica TaxID=2989819 RepID=A0ABT3JWB6_9XANT|nr:AraC family transcriptional regulator [Xanthomonas sp. H13-6]MCW4455088.1 AraC family transcriptional regulator [Flavobacterium sp. MXW15]MCW4472746.1 AraC family transcriptional regulator [Xanthomonas sp. H13-6]
MTPSCPLSFRSYDASGVPHRHRHVQLVLPVRGELEMEIEGRGGRLDVLHGAVVVPGSRHVQCGRGQNRFLVVDCDAGDLPAEVLEQGQRTPYMVLPAAVRRLAEFVELASPGPGVPAEVARHALPLLLQAFSAAPGSGGMRLGALCRRIELSPGESWPVERMARLAGMSASALHARFRSELGQTPQAWLSQLRLRWAQEQLATGTLPIAQIAGLAGYSDQSALTRAMRRDLGVTPGEYRRRQLS